jgi:hypothetical protein
MSPGQGHGVDVSGDYAYVAAYDCGLRVVDVSNPSSPVEVGYCDTPGYAERVCVTSGFAYLADGDAGLRIIDVSVPSDPYEVAYYATSGYAQSVHVQQNYAYVTDSNVLRVLDVSVPTAPLEVGHYNLPFSTLFPNGFGVFASGSYIYVADGVCGLQIYQNLLVGVEELNSDSGARLPAYSLYQNCPNPFQHSTAISYSLPAASHATLGIYDITGRLVETLVDDTQQPGIHEVRWNRKNNPSGVYFYRLKACPEHGRRAGEFVETRKMVVVD